MKDLFSIGQVAKLFRINIRTLRYYDQIGLLQPSEVDKRTGYRYYSTQQFERLNTILYLRALDTPLKNIMRFFEHKSTDRMMELLREQEEATGEKIRQMERVRRKLEQRISTLEYAASSILEEIREVYLPERKAALLRKEITADDDLEHPIRELEQQNSLGPIIFLGKVGLTVSQDNLLRRKFDVFSGIFLIFEEGDEAEGSADILPQGDYVTVAFSDTHKKSAFYYEKLADYIDAKGYWIAGDSVEITIIDSGLTGDISQFVTEIQIPVRKNMP
ncbi:MerR family transcriptional regulator [Anaerovorax odorimutans]|uniref:MerR family transcriptional regulator n=1 Tax=Anaerovorax odorimutans TaxID=109327 RepID=A0ABT1RL87_9FIRM|nr:MerR family transcriptional regulator [Anaerovorax odorimutans]MCQ4635927.1 MerR family transcriptional regulator [Anaerovorax odorimutans]